MFRLVYTENMRTKTAEDYQVLMHRYAMDHIKEGVSYKEALDYLNSQGYSFKFNSNDDHIMLAYGDIFINATGGGVLSTIRNNPTYNFHMTTEAYFRLLEYEELVEARRNALEAKRFSIAALAIAALSLLAQINT